MIVRTTKAICDMVAAALLGVMLLLSIAVWHLAQGPVPLEFLTPHLVRALNGDGSPFTVTIENTNLAWAGWDRTLDIKVVGVRARAQDGRVVANVPEMSVGLSVKGLLRGIVAPTGIDVIGPTMRMQRDRTGVFSMALGKEGGESADPEVMNRLFLAVQSEPDPNRPVTYLKHIRILNAQLIVDDRMTGVSWGAPQTDVVLLKEDGKLRGDFFARLDVGGTSSELNGTVSWRPNSKSIEIATKFSDLKIDRLAKKLPKFGWLDIVDLTVRGSADMTMSIKGKVESASFDLRAGKGHIAYTDLWPKGLPIASARLRGTFDGDIEKLEIEQLFADIEIAKVTARATAIRVGKGLKIDGRVNADKLAFENLAAFWPKSIAARPRAWVTSNITSGNIVDTDVNLSLGIADLAKPAVSVETMSGTLKMQETTIYHVEGLPAVHDMAASAVFTRDRFIAKIRHGKSAGLTVTDARVVLTELAGDTEKAEIDVTVSGWLRDALALIDSPALGFATRFGIHPDTVSGEIDSQLKFSFPILNELPLNKVEIQTTSTLTRPKVPNFAFGQTVSADTLALTVNRDAMELSGNAKIGGVDAAIKWVELFGEAEEFPRRYEAKAVLSQAQRDTMGLLNLSPFLEGPIGVELAVSQPRKGTKKIAAKMALKDAKLYLPGIRWRKPAGREAVAWLRMLVAPDGGLEVPEFSVGTPDLTVSGSVGFDRHRKFKSLVLGKFTLGRTDLAGRVEAMPDGKYNVEINGATLDAAPFIVAEEGASSGDKAEPEDPSLPPVTIQLNIDRVWFDDKIPVDRLTGGLTRGETGWQNVNLSGLVGENQKVTFSYRDRSGRQRVVMRSDNAGSALRALDTLDTVDGGTMVLNAGRSAKSETTPWKGSLVITDFVLRKAPLMAKILTVASLTGIGDTLSGKGIRFARLDTPFEFSNGIATITKARTVGAELGFTAQGSIDLNADTIALSGTIVPAYTLNSVLGKIPILGRILTGKEGSGIFAATYKVEGSLLKPTVSVNPLAALAPGFLRDLVGIFDGSVKADPGSSAPAEEIE